MHSEIAFYLGTVVGSVLGIILVALLGANGRDDQNFVRVGKEWMSVEEYRRRYVDNQEPGHPKPEPPCKGTLRCPQALDVFCEECPK